VENGGNLITTYKAGFSDEYLKVYSDTQPHILHKALGLHYDQFTLPYNVTVTYNGQTSDASEWMEMVHCDTAVSLAQYEHHTWNRYTAVAQNNYGKGRTLYLATLFGANTLRAILAEFLGEIIYADTYENTAKLPFDAVSPVTVKQGINNEGRHIMYFLNYSKDPQTVRNIAGNATELLSGGTVSANETITLEPWGVAILEYSI
jgi:beta-galactosidase